MLYCSTGAVVPVCSYVRSISTQTQIRRWQGHSDNNKYIDWALFSLSLSLWNAEISGVGVRVVYFVSLANIQEPPQMDMSPIMSLIHKTLKTSLSSCFLFALLLNWCCVFVQWPYRNSNKKLDRRWGQWDSTCCKMEKDERKVQEIQKNHRWRFSSVSLPSDCSSEVETENALWDFSTLTGKSIKPSSLSFTRSHTWMTGALPRLLGATPWWKTC